MVAGHGRITRQHDARLCRVLANRVGDHLVHAHARVQHGALGNLGAREQAAGLRRMDALTGRRLVEQPVDDVDLVLEGLERRERLAELHVGAIAGRAPMVFIDAASHEHDAEALGEGRGGRGGGGAKNAHGFEPRQRHDDPGSAQHRAARNSTGKRSGDSVLRQEFLGHVTRLFNALLGVEWTRAGVGSETAGS